MAQVTQKVELATDECEINMPVEVTVSKLTPECFSSSQRPNDSFPSHVSHLYRKAFCCLVTPIAALSNITALCIISLCVG